MTTPLRKALFLGTPEFAVPALERLDEAFPGEILAVVTQPDRPAGRGHKLKAPAVKIHAEKRGLPVYQPKWIKDIRKENDRFVGKDEELVQLLNTQGTFDYIVCVAYGKLIPKDLLEFPKHGVINIHPSLLPRWRGAAPLQHTLLAGDEKTAVCIMDMIEELDAGPVYSCVETTVASDETLESLHNRLAEIGADALVECIPDICSGALKATPQANEGVTYAHKWEKSDSAIIWEESAEASDCRIRACTPVPGARARLGDVHIKLFDSYVAEDQNFPDSLPGTVVECNKAELVLACGSGYLGIRALAFPGKKTISIAEAINGRLIRAGDRLQ